jgi:hypothetical protein
MACSLEWREQKIGRLPVTWHGVNKGWGGRGPPHGYESCDLAEDKVANPCPFFIFGFQNVFNDFVPSELVFFFRWRGHSGYSIPNAAGCGLFGISSSSWNKIQKPIEWISWILMPRRLNNIPQRPHPAARHKKGGGFRHRDTTNYTVEHDQRKIKTLVLNFLSKILLHKCPPIHP